MTAAWVCRKTGARRHVLASSALDGTKRAAIAFAITRSVPLEQAIILALMIFAMATLYSSVGHGGGSGYLAAMALFGLAAGAMKPTALTLNVFVATIGVIRFGRAGLIPVGLLLPLVLASIPAAFFGGWLQVDARLYKQIVGGILLVAAVNIFVRAGQVARDAAGAELPLRPPPVLVLIAIGAAIGFLAGLTGTGGGIFLSPLILIAGWADAKRTAGVSVAFILANSIAGLGGHIAHVREIPSEIVMWAPAAIAGGLIGSSFGARKLASPTLRRLLAVVLVIAGVKLLRG